jgi:hypothetical protein
MKERLLIHRAFFEVVKERRGDRCSQKATVPNISRKKTKRMAVTFVIFTLPWRNESGIFFA